MCLDNVARNVFEGSKWVQFDLMLILSVFIVYRAEIAQLMFNSSVLLFAKH